MSIGSSRLATAIRDLGQGVRDVDHVAAVP
jgi:hypothetical protein